MGMFVPALLGVFVVLQAGLNRKIAQVLGLPTAVLLNALVLTVCATMLWVSGIGRESGWTIGERSLAWWFVCPGMIGMVLVFGGPWALARFGAVYTFTLLIGAQLAASLVWDYAVEGAALSPQRILGVGVTWLGVVIALR